MKILSASQIREADAYTIQQEPIKSIDLMERAASRFFQRFVEKFSSEKPILVVCGPGNNGGDGLAIARLLYWHKFQVKVMVPSPTKKTSDDFRTNYQRLPSGIVVLYPDDILQSPQQLDTVLVIDALFGTGLSRAIEGELAQIIQVINASSAYVVSVDIPSGLSSDSDSESDRIMQADETFTFEAPKRAFLLPETHAYCGRWEIIPIDLSKACIEAMECTHFLSTEQVIRGLLRNRSPFQHKGDFGRALLMAGAKQTLGAAVLAAKACLRSGVGLLRVHIPKDASSILNVTIPEAMTWEDPQADCLSQLPDTEAYQAIGIGPGIGQAKETEKLLLQVIQQYRGPLVIDADGLNLLAKQKDGLALLPPGTILTPHLKEFSRLAKKETFGFKRLDALQEMAQKYQLSIVLKGAYSAVALADGSLHFNTTGNPGMATAGSGDVLTGIILALLAQGYSSDQAARLGTYLHGLAGDCAAAELGQEALIASDIISHLPHAFKMLTSASNHI
ncbi:NAD(P)H-hydrate dehydratase [Cytophagales bacterium LB-30]|uniref:Bifunctional NAD(P)H-hydrate repair enzyme n=1 Tax=Shiella aurantiaca TaxID=3058365 RepID=A0ABT8F2V0_9BACT|nr:NAD(P)H-hydrate dehydratase [Shiella aurantiaca]MDN4164776.1 NAD(P)H-hydrate dehydratase [Shiella aurantiaca]